MANNFLDFFQASKQIHHIMIIISASGNLTIYLASNKSFRRLVFKRYFKCDYSTSIGMISHKKSLITIFGLMHKIKNFIKKGPV